MSVESSEWKSWRLRRRTCTQTLGSALAARGFPSRYLRRKSPISVSSNGFIWLGSNSDSACCNGDVGEFLAQPGRIAVVWADLDPSQAGSVHFNALPNRAVITWNQVPEYGESTTFTCQLQLESNGNITFYWDGAVDIASHTTLVGVTPGNGATNPFATNLSNLPFNSGGRSTIYESFAAGTFDLRGVVMQLTPSGGGFAAAARSGCGIGSFREFGSGCPAATRLNLTSGGNNPRIGTTFDMVFGEALPTANAAFGMLGATDNPTGLALDSIGMTGCRLWLNIAAFQSVPLLGRYSVYSLTFPNSPSLVGCVLFAQVGTLAPGANPAGITVSNGARIELGN